jgi:outer membrane immunogenic protein
MRSSIFKAIAASALAAMAATSAASAADLAARPYTKAPVMEPIYNWTGFYIGGNVGYSWGRSSDTSTLTNGAGAVLFTSADRANMDGVIGGGQIGYNWQVQNWVWGLEADIQGSGQKGSRAYLCPTGVCTPPFGVIAVFPGPAVPVSLDQKLEWFGTVRGRVGVLATPQVLFYATGGLAYGNVKTQLSGGFPGVAVDQSFSHTKVGYAVGGGIESPFDLFGWFGKNWTSKTEYLFVDLGRSTDSVSAVPGLTFTTRAQEHMLRTGLNYHFNSPVVAKY